VLILAFQAYEARIGTGLSAIHGSFIAAAGRSCIPARHGSYYVTSCHVIKSPY